MKHLYPEIARSVMEKMLKLPRTVYQEAFSLFSDAGKDEFVAERSYGNYLVRFKEKFFRIAHFQDIMQSYKSYLEKSPIHIYTELPEEIWQVILTEKIEADPENFIIDFYNSWNASWDEALYDGNDWEQFELDKQQSFVDFNHICFEIRKGSWNIMTIADIDSERLVPAIATAIKAQYAKENEFYEELVSLMTSRYYDQIGNGSIFSKVILDEAGANEQIFFIYSVDGILD